MSAAGSAAKKIEFHFQDNWNKDYVSKPWDENTKLEYYKLQQKVQNLKDGDFFDRRKTDLLCEQGEFYASVTQSYCSQFFKEHVKDLNAGSQKIIKESLLKCVKDSNFKSGVKRLIDGKFKPEQFQREVMKLYDNFKTEEDDNLEEHKVKLQNIANSVWQIEAWKEAPIKISLVNPKNIYFFRADKKKALEESSDLQEMYAFLLKHTEGVFEDETSEEEEKKADSPVPEVPEDLLKDLYKTAKTIDDTFLITFPLKRKDTDDAGRREAEKRAAEDADAKKREAERRAAKEAKEAKDKAEKDKAAKEAREAKEAKDKAAKEAMEAKEAKKKTDKEDKDPTGKMKDIDRFAGDIDDVLEKVVSGTFGKKPRTEELEETDADKPAAKKGRSSKKAAALAEHFDIPTGGAIKSIRPADVGDAGPSLRSRGSR